MDVSAVMETVKAYGISIVMHEVEGKEFHGEYAAIERAARIAVLDARIEEHERVCNTVRDGPCNRLAELQEQREALG